MKKIISTAITLLGLLSLGTSQADTVIQVSPHLLDARGSAISPLDFKYEPITIRGSASPSGSFNSGIMFLADQLERNVILDTKTKPTIVNNIVSLTDLDSTSDIGRLIAENLRHEMQLRLWTVSDIRLQSRFTINAEGEFSLSRDIKKLRENIPASNVLTGTYTNTDDGVLVNVRVLDLVTGQILSTAQTRFTKSRFIAGLVGEKPKAIPVIRLSQ